MARASPNASCMVVDVVGARHWALIVVPCGMDAMRVSDPASSGVLLVAGMFIHRPGSKWMGIAAPSPLPVSGFVTSEIDWV